MFDGEMPVGDICQRRVKDSLLENMLSIDTMKPAGLITEATDRVFRVEG